MAVFSKHKFYDGAITTQKIMADTIIPADVDETQSFNFSAIGSSFAGVFAKKRIQAWSVSLTNASTARGYPSGNFAATPIIFACHALEGTSSSNLYALANSASSYTLYAGTISVTASSGAYVIAIDMS
jgi:hypothetical protein